MSFHAQMEQPFYALCTSCGATTAGYGAAPSRCGACEARIELFVSPPAVADVLRDELAKTREASAAAIESMRSVINLKDREIIQLQNGLRIAQQELRSAEAKIRQLEGPPLDRWAIGLACGQWFADAPWRFGSRFSGLEVD